MPRGTLWRPLEKKMAVSPATVQAVQSGLTSLEKSVGTRLTALAQDLSGRASSVERAVKSVTAAHQGIENVSKVRGEKVDKALASHERKVERRLAAFDEKLTNLDV